jgi:predicted nucleotidyltransferase
LTSVKIFSVDVAAVRRGMDDYARKLLATYPEVEEVVVFGSFENDTYAPGSDIDVFIVLREANDSPRDRIPRFLPQKSFGVPVDVFPFTRAEMEERRDSPLLVAVRKSRWQYRRAPIRLGEHTLQ